MSKTFRVVFSGMIAALCIVLLLCTGFFPFATVALPAVAGVLMVPIVVELGVKWACLVYAATAAVSFFITPEPSAMLLYIFFFGYYPVVKALIERLHKSMLEWAMKFLLVNAAMVVLFLLASWLFGLEKVLPEVQNFGKFVYLGIWIGANAAFLIYDLALTRLIGSYVRWFKPKYVDKLRRSGR
ncbi:MAG: hypothetical protein HFJ85_03690 [Oscillospiraceae bacterium]|nr:hypothetical protein [Oscillospiraceae bacterium]